MKYVLTTGEVAEICYISQQSVIRCFDSGYLKGYRIPGSKHRRITIENLREFIYIHGIPRDRFEKWLKKNGGRNGNAE